MSDIQKRLTELSEGRVSNWSKEADFRIKNQKWLRYSHNIAGRILAALEDKENMTQKQLAELMGVSPQQISKILSGNENLTLETISRLSDVLGVELIAFPDYKYNTPAKDKLPAKKKQTPKE